MSSLKVGFVLDDSLDTADGVQQYILTLGRWLQTQGHDVHYLVGHTKRSDVASVHSLARTLKVRFNQNRMSMPLPASKKAIAALLQREQFDVLHVQMPYSPLLAARVIAAAGPHTAVVGTFHVAPHSKFVEMANHALGRWLRGSLRRFDAVMSVSSVAQTFAKKTFGIESVIVPNTVDLQPYAAAKPYTEYANVHTIFFLGRLVQRKGCQYLLSAIQLLPPEAREKLQVVICGDGPLRARLQEYVSTHQLHEIVTFKGFIDEADKPRYLASADIAVYPSTGGESFGIVLLEAMAAARGTVLAGNNPGYASVMAGRPQTLFNPHDTQALSDLLVQLLNDPAERQAAHAWQQQHVQQYAVPHVGAKVLATYRDALRKRQH